MNNDNFVWHIKQERYGPRGPLGTPNCDLGCKVYESPEPFASFTLICFKDHQF